MTYKNSGEIDNNSSDSIFGIAIRLSFSLRNQEDSSYALFFNTTFPKIRGKAEYEITIFPTNLKIQEKYRAMLNRVLFFTPDFSSIYEGTIYNILDKQDQLDIISDPGCDRAFRNVTSGDCVHVCVFRQGSVPHQRTGRPFGSAVRATAAPHCRSPVACRQTARS